MLTGPMLLSATVLALLLVAPVSDSAPPTAIAALPDEPGVVILPDTPILQTVVADVDGDGRREVIRLVLGAGEAVLAEVWGLDADRWHLRGEPVEVVPPSRVGVRIDRVYQATPVQLLVRRVDGAERVTVASQPHFEEIDVGEPCCLILHDLAISDGSALRRPVSGPSDFADAIIVIDMDGDDTDELLSTQSLPPAGDIGFPIQARVHRWVDGAFGPPTETRLPVGSGDSPFRLGDSDGVPGDEAAIVSTLGPSGIFRIRLIEGDGLALDAAGIVADQAVAVPLETGRGVALVGPVVGLMVGAWPAGEDVSEPIAESVVTDARIVGTVAVDGQSRLVVHQPSTDAVHLLSLPGLLPQELPIRRSAAAAALWRAQERPFSGPLPGGGIDGETTVIHAGRLIPSPGRGDPSGTSLMATLAGAEAVGLVGDDVIVLQHAPFGQRQPGREGGALMVPTVLDEAWTSIAPFEMALQPEAGDLEPPLRGLLRRDGRDGIAAGPAGFVAEVMAPPGSRVVVADFDASAVRAAIVVPASGRIDVPFVTPTVTTANPGYLATLLVMTPAGHAQLARWGVQIVTEPPPVDLTVRTPFGSSAVEIGGQTSPGASVRVDGSPVEVTPTGRFVAGLEMPPWPTEVSVEVSDGLGNVARHTVSGIGLFDYRGLPWVPITVGLVAMVGVALLLRVPRSIPLPRRADDDAELEELEPD